MAREERYQVGKYVDLMIDVAFKRVFGQPANKDLLIALLSVIIPEVKIDEITYLDKERNGVGLDDKKSVFDIPCDTDQGEKVLVEVQVKPQKYFRDRTLYYAAQEILYEHRESDIDYTLSSLYVISLLDFELEHDSPAEDKFVWRYSLRENETGETMTKALNFTFVELSKFNKRSRSLQILKMVYTFVSSIWAGSRRDRTGSMRRSSGSCSRWPNLWRCLPNNAKAT